MASRPAALEAGPRAVPGGTSANSARSPAWSLPVPRRLGVAGLIRQHPARGSPSTRSPRSFGTPDVLLFHDLTAQLDVRLEAANSRWGHLARLPPRSPPYRGGSGPARNPPAHTGDLDHRGVGRDQHETLVERAGLPPAPAAATACYRSELLMHAGRPEPRSSMVERRFPQGASPRILLSVVADEPRPRSPGCLGWSALRRQGDVPADTGHALWSPAEPTPPGCSTSSTSTRTPITRSPRRSWQIELAAPPGQLLSAAAAPPHLARRQRELPPRRTT